MYREEDLAAISALQHYIFCPRQCALIHLEKAWSENFLTAQGRVMHERVHQSAAKRSKQVRAVFSLIVRSMELGVAGQADVVEFYSEKNDFRPFPVEYKRGSPKKTPADRVQLCAQAICLEEMTGVPVPQGALFYGRKHRRISVHFDPDLRRITFDTARAVHALLNEGKTPSPVFEAKCRACSLKALCLPGVCEKKTAIFEKYMEKIRL